MDDYSSPRRQCKDHRSYGLVANAQGPAHKGILVETSPGFEIELEVRAEEAFVEAGSRPLSELPSRVARRQRDRPEIGHRLDPTL